MKGLTISGGHLSHEFEKEIQELLLGNKNSDVAAKLAFKKLMTESPGRKERKAYVNFLLNCGHYREVLDIFATWFQEEERIPFYSFCHCLYQTKYKPDTEFLRYVAETQVRLNKEDQAPHFSMWEAQDKTLAITRKESKEALLQLVVRKRDSLFAKLEFFRAQRMFEEEEKLLSEMSIYFPEDPDLSEELVNFKNRWADNVIAKSSNKPLIDTDDEKGMEQNQSEKIAALPIINEIKKLTESKKSLSYNLAIGLYFFELFDHSLDVIQKAPNSPAHDWFQIELLMKCRRYVECLDALVNIEKRYADDPETSFASVYYRARALKALGRTDRAIELMKSIVNIRPNYRSSHALLLKWSQN